jgi:thioredoxin-dependent peroxiredoxin
MARLEVGALAPDFRLPSTAGPIALSERLRNGPVLLVFYPGDDTPVCTRQLCDYRDHLDVFRNLDVQVIAINPQSEASHQKFADKHGLPFPLVSDPKGAVCRQYGAVNLLGLTKRGLVLVGRDGRVRWQRFDFPVFYESADDIREALEQEGVL